MSAVTVIPTTIFVYRAQLGAADPTDVDGVSQLGRIPIVRVKKGEMLSVADVEDILAIPLLGVIPESQAVLRSNEK